MCNTNVFTERRKRMSIVSVRVNDDEMKVLNEFSKLYGCGVSSMIKRIVFERLEDEYYLKAFEEYEKEKANGTLKTYPISDLWKESDL